MRYARGAAHLFFIVKQSLAKLISGISSPFLMVAIFGLWAVGATAHTATQFLVLGGLCVILVGGLPFLYILVQMQRGAITDIHVAVREQRGMPFVVATVGGILLGLCYAALGAPRELLAVAVALVASGFVFGTITQYWKISIHAAAYVGSVIIVSFIVSPWCLLLLMALPAIIWARLVRGKHNAAQAVVASILNAVCVSAVLWFLLMR